MVSEKAPVIKACEAMTDLVTELLLPVAQRDEAKVAELLERYQKSL